MYNPKDIQFVGKHDYDALSARRYARLCEKSFSVNIFKWGLKNNGKWDGRKSVVVNWPQ